MSKTASFDKLRALLSSLSRGSIREYLFSIDYGDHAATPVRLIEVVVECGLGSLTHGRFEGAPAAQRCEVAGPGPRDDS